jgi:hypothetical protein
MVRVIVCVALLASGCAVDPPAPTKTVTKIEFKTRICRVAMELDTEVCRTKKSCGEIRRVQKHTTATPLAET